MIVSRKLATMVTTLVNMATANASEGKRASPTTPSHEHRALAKHEYWRHGRGAQRGGEPGEHRQQNAECSNLPIEITAETRRFRLRHTRVKGFNRPVDQYARGP